MSYCVLVSEGGKQLTPYMYTCLLTSNMCTQISFRVRFLFPSSLALESEEPGEWIPLSKLSGPFPQFPLIACWAC